MKHSLTIAIVAFMLFAANVFAEPLGTGFTYQGELQQSGAPANGTYDFEFNLFDALTGGVALNASPFQLEDVSVLDGVFTVELDFGSGVFDGTQLWLEIALREGASVDAHEVLTPRQKLTSYPYDQSAAVAVLQSQVVGLQAQVEALIDLFDGASRGIDPNTNQDTLAFASSVSSEAVSIRELSTTDRQGDLPLCYNSNGALLPCTSDFKIPPGSSLLGSWTGMKLTDPNYSGADTCYDDEVALNIASIWLESITTRRNGVGIQIFQTSTVIRDGFADGNYSAFGVNIVYTLRFDTYGNSYGDWFETNGGCYGTWSFTKD